MDQVINTDSNDSIGIGTTNANGTINVGEQPRKRGRPVGSSKRTNANANGNETENGTARLTVEPQSLKRGRPRKAATLSNDEAQAQASVSIMMLDTVAVSLAGPDAAISQMERFLIEPPLARMAMRNPAVSIAMQRYADPFTLLVGLLMYLARVAAGIREKRNATVDTGGGMDVAAPRVDDVPMQSSYDINAMMRVS